MADHHQILHGVHLVGVRSGKLILWMEAAPFHVANSTQTKRHGGSNKSSG